MSELGGLPKLPRICSQCGEPFDARACGPTHALIWWSIVEPVMYAVERANAATKRADKRDRQRHRSAPSGGQPNE